MNERVNHVGFSQLIRLEWLRYTADLVIAGKKRDTIRDELREMLKDKLSLESDAKWGNREKTILVLLKIWSSVPAGLEDFRDAGLEFLKMLPQEMTLPVHWGMSMAVYPFFGVTATNVGRLLRLQGSFSVSQVQRRLREQYGERETVSRSAQRVIRSFYDWGVITESGKKGIYLQAETKNIPGISLISWLIEAVLYTTGEMRGNLREIADSPCLFPFNLERIIPGQLIGSGRVEVNRHNLDEDLIFIKKGTMGVAPQALRGCTPGIKGLHPGH
jgi:hypothetical protein